MEKSDIIKTFLNKGVQISNTALSFFIDHPEKLETFLNNTSHYPSTITLETINKTVGQENTVKTIKSGVLNERSSIKDIVALLDNRYGFLSSILGKKPELEDLVSINKISKDLRKFSIMGVVKEKTTPLKTIVLEDKSDKLEIKLENDLINQVVEDEIVGIFCENNNGALVGKKIVFPELPFQREINKTKEDIETLFISDIHMDSEKFNLVAYEKMIKWLQEREKETFAFIVGNISSKKEDFLKIVSDIPKKHKVFIIDEEKNKSKTEGTNFFPNPSLIEIDDLKILFFNNEKIVDYMNVFGSPEQTMTSLLKKRHFDPTFSPNKKFYKNDPYLLDIVPDLIVCGGVHLPSTSNYKGVTTITMGSFVNCPIFWSVKLRTRDVFKIDFS